MPLLNMNFNGKTIPEKISKAGYYLSKLTGNANFPAPNPTLAVLKSATDALEKAYKDSRGGGKSSTVILNEAESDIDSLISLLGAYILSASGGDEVKILSAGADVRKKSGPVGTLPAPTNLLAKVSLLEGCVDCKWERVKNSKCYLIQVSTDHTGTDWNFIGASTSTKYTVEELETGKKYMFRVASVGAAGKSPWSDPALGMAG